MKRIYKEKRKLKTFKGTLGSHVDESCVKYYLLSQQCGKLFLVYDADIDEDLRRCLWKEVKVSGYPMSNSNLLYTIEIIPPSPTETRAKFIKKFKRKYSEISGRVPQLENSYMVAV